ncbi:hypothetical protein GCM10009104_04740 [Marinobacterium maritimum]|uniref:F-type H+-transporting ATPase subunit gamma n=1 Tax=Marinobacterium maritimum TaxID=500162 RepID=A0ABN1I335_9GAMM
MTHRHALEQRRTQLSEAQEIMESMKSLAFMEVRKLEQRATMQRALVDTLEQVAADFLHFYPDFHAWAPPEATIYLLLGSERGFSGAFNGRLLEQLADEPGAEQARLIVCGHKLHSRLKDDPRLLASLDGPSVQDEVQGFLLNLLERISQEQRKSALTIKMISHDPAVEQVRVEYLLPPFQTLLNTERSDLTPPLLNLPPRAFYAELVDHYLLASLNEKVCSSLQAENHYRMLHLDGAVRYLQDRLDRMRLKSNQLRKEEITEEIEVILLSADSVRPGNDTV